MDRRGRRNSQDRGGYRAHDRGNRDSRGNRGNDRHNNDRNNPDNHMGRDHRHHHRHHDNNDNGGGGGGGRTNNRDNPNDRRNYSGLNFIPYLFNGISAMELGLLVMITVSLLNKYLKKRRADGKSEAEWFRELEIPQGTWEEIRQIAQVQTQVQAAVSAATQPDPDGDIRMLDVDDFGTSYFNPPNQGGHQGFNGPGNQYLSNDEELARRLLSQVHGGKRASASR